MDVQCSLKFIAIYIYWEPRSYAFTLHITYSTGTIHLGKWFANIVIKLIVQVNVMFTHYTFRPYKYNSMSVAVILNFFSHHIVGIDGKFLFIFRSYRLVFCLSSHMYVQQKDVSIYLYLSIRCSVLSVLCYKRKPVN